MSGQGIKLGLPKYQANSRASVDTHASSFLSETESLSQYATAAAAVVRLVQRNAAL